MKTSESRKTLHWLAMAVVLAGLPLAAAAETWVIQVGDNFFSDPQGNGAGNLLIQVGDTVRWENPAGGAPHDVTSLSDAWVPPPTAPSWEPFEVTFNEVGSFDYRCTVHPISMTGTITVVDGSARAELGVQSFVAPTGDFFAFEELNLATTIQNTGDAGSGAFTITYYASADSDITAADHVLGSAQVGDIATMSSTQQQDTVAVPDSIPHGTYFIGVIITFIDGNAADNRGFDAAPVNFLGPFFINAGVNEAWLDFATAGQGFFFTVFGDLGLFFLSWFTFDTLLPDEPLTAALGWDGHRWVTAIGSFVAGNTVTLSVELTEGGVFNSPDPEVVQTPNYGTIAITFIHCNAAILAYDFPDLALSGTINLTRLTADNIELCKALSAEIRDMQ